MSDEQPTWSDDAEERETIQASQQVLKSLAQALYQVPETRYARPAGGFNIAR
ncbi:hypothetical protein [Gryllotalpicola protaetiae]|uniref:hypothetical protein n=1 Tax=Gryllotalpicola protaetiae TaxID=2419771 RepID=UPI0013C4F6C9|nr:hypothetical protein [Gryllotalpicola protaetiae]